MAAMVRTERGTLVDMIRDKRGRGGLSSELQIRYGRSPLFLIEHLPKESIQRQPDVERASDLDQPQHMSRSNRVKKKKT